MYVIEGKGDVCLFVEMHVQIIIEKVVLLLFLFVL